MGLIIEGASYGADETLEFDGVGVEVTNFLNWANVNGVDQNYDPGQSADYIVAVKGLKDVATTFSDGELRIRHGYRASSNTNREFIISQSADVKFSFDSMLPLSDAMDHASDLQDLVTIAADRVCTFKEVLLYHPDFSATRGGHTSYRDVRHRRESWLKVKLGPPP